MAPAGRSVAAALVAVAATAPGSPSATATQNRTAEVVPAHVLTSAGADVTDYVMRAVLKQYATDPLNTGRRPHRQHPVAARRRRTRSRPTAPAGPAPTW